VSQRAQDAWTQITQSAAFVEALYALTFATAEHPSLFDIVDVLVDELVRHRHVDDGLLDQGVDPARCRAALWLHVPSANCT
jgi:hypothetical protein